MVSLDVNPDTCCQLSTCTFFLRSPDSVTGEPHSWSCQGFRKTTLISVPQTTSLWDIAVGLSLAQAVCKHTLLEDMQIIILKIKLVMVKRRKSLETSMAAAQAQQRRGKGKLLSGEA